MAGLIVIDVDIADMQVEAGCIGYVEIVNPKGEWASELDRIFKNPPTFNVEMSSIDVMFSCGTVRRCNVIYDPWKHSYMLIWKEHD